MDNLVTFKANDFYQQLFKKLSVPAFKQKGITDQTIINYISKYYLNGMISIVSEWVKNNCEDDLLLICEIIILYVKS